MLVLPNGRFGGVTTQKARPTYLLLGGIFFTLIVIITSRPLFRSTPITPDVAHNDAVVHEPTPSALSSDSGVDFDPVSPGVPAHPNHQELYSLTSSNGEYYSMWWNGANAYNGNIIPHPARHDRFLLLAQHRYDHREENGLREELSCEAYFKTENNFLVCENDPMPISTPEVRNTCRGVYKDWDGSPRDARMFIGKGGHPFIVYGSLSTYTCLALWIRDARMLLQPFAAERESAGLFNETTELHRPEPWNVVEKNHFIFWSWYDGQAYTHYDLVPQRGFSRLKADGTVGKNLAENTATRDDACLARYLPRILNDEHERIHQGTNSLSLTLCEQKDPTCVPDASNTFIMHIFQQKINYNYHAVYEPYVILFHAVAPFSLFAISRRPYWIHGRGALTNATGASRYIAKPETMPHDHSEMFYVTSMNWKKRSYHGFLDSELFISFGIEDTHSGVIDILAGDLVHDLAYC